MGLDMYLKAEKYVSRCPEDLSIFDFLVKSTGITPTTDEQEFTVSASVGYWRKANAIHRWFVENVQEGRDECQRSYVSREQLETLRDTCRKAINSLETVDGVVQKELAEKIMPTTSGLFFGSTDYDEYYLQGLRDTAELLDKILADEALKDCDFYYRASW